MLSLLFRRRAVAYAAAMAVTVVCAMALPPGSESARAQQAAAADSAGQRLSQLEEQMVDLQVAIGTLQSLVARGPVGPGAVANPPGPGPGAPAPGGNGDLSGRVDAMETQIRALTNQIVQLTEQISQLQGLQGAAPQLAPGPEPALQAPDAQPAPFGTTTVQPFQGEPSLAPAAQTPAPTLDPGQAQPGTAAPLAGQPNERLAALPSAGDPKVAYEEAYAHLMRRDYAAAESSFQRFLASFPNDELAGNAQYWLGETYYVRAQYKQAADAFLESYRKYRTGSKAPDSLLKLGMALNQLGQSKAACDTYNELAAKFPSAPDHVKQRATGERKRAGC